MDGMNERMGLFPALLDPARKAAARLLAENLTMAPIEDKADFMVAPEGEIDENLIYFRFEYEGMRFVIFEKPVV